MPACSIKLPLGTLAYMRLPCSSYSGLGQNSASCMHSWELSAAQGVFPKVPTRQASAYLTHAHQLLHELAEVPAALHVYGLPRGQLTNPDVLELLHAKNRWWA